MDSQELARRKSYMNIELCNDFKLAFDIALSKISVDEEEYFKNNMMYLEATNHKHPKWPNTLFFKDRVTRETFKIGYDLLDTIQI